jgi:hypothetical protein
MGSVEGGKVSDTCVYLGMGSLHDGFKTAFAVLYFLTYHTYF